MMNIDELKERAAALDKTRDRDNAAYKALMAAQTAQQERAQTLEERVSGIEKREPLRDERIAGLSKQLDEQSDLIAQLMELASQNIDRMAARDVEFDQLNTSVITALDVRGSSHPVVATAIENGVVTELRAEIVGLRAENAALNERVSALEARPEPQLALPAPTQDEWVAAPSIAELADDGYLFAIRDDQPDEEAARAFAYVMGMLRVCKFDGEFEGIRGRVIASETFDRAEAIISSEVGMSLVDLGFIKRGENARWHYKKAELEAALSEDSALGTIAYGHLIEQQQEEEAA